MRGNTQCLSYYSCFNMNRHRHRTCYVLYERKFNSQTLYFDGELKEVAIPYLELYRTEPWENMIRQQPALVLFFIS